MPFGALSWVPFLKKGPPKITEGGPLGPHWPIFRINPVHLYSKNDLYWQTWPKECELITELKVGFLGWNSKTIHE